MTRNVSFGYALIKIPVSVSLLFPMKNGCMWGRDGGLPIFLVYSVYERSVYERLT